MPKAGAAHAHGHAVAYAQEPMPRPESTGTYGAMPEAATQPAPQPATAPAPEPVRAEEPRPAPATMRGSHFDLPAHGEKTMVFTLLASGFEAGIPLPDRPLNQSPSGFGYMGGSQGPQIAFNATYLRQDFSVMQKVEKPSPWPEWQRFDFVVRERVLSHEEAAQFRAELGAETADGLTRHQKAALTALRGLTGADAEPTAAAWRRVLDLPPR